MTKPVKYLNEGAVKKQVKKLLDKHGWFWWMPPANGFGRTGIADINALRDGVFMAVETKFGKNTTTPMQKGFLSSVVAAQGFAFVVTDQNMTDFEAWLGAFDRAVEAQAKQEPVAEEDGAMMLNAMRELTLGY